MMEVTQRRLQAAQRRRHITSRAIGFIAVMADIAYLLLASALGFSGYEYLVFGTFAEPLRYVGVGLVIAAMFTLAMHSAGAYRPDTIRLLRYQIRLIFILIPGVLVFMLTVIFFLKLGASFSRGSILSTAIIASAGLIAIRLAWHSYLPSALSRSVFRERRMLVLCHDRYDVEGLQREAAANGIAIAEVIRLCGETDPPNSLSDLRRYDRIAELDEVLIVWREPSLVQLQPYLRELKRLTLPVRLCFDGMMAELVSGVRGNIGDIVTFQAQRPPLTVYEQAIKRAFDIAFSCFALLSLSPLLVAVALAIKIDSRGPVLFMQHRKGYGGRSFRILKFRSMTVLEDAADIRQAVRNDPRVTRVGAFIRATSLDELPQFINILLGDMSVVGPRPHAAAHDDLYDAQIARYAFRRHVKPGLTGWAQINNCRGETETLAKMEARIAHDLWYIDNWSFWLDMKIVIRTVLKMHDSNTY